MALAEDAKRISAQFELTDASLNQHVTEFLKQMSDGLGKDGTSISQIPTYVTGVPNGTEKVSTIGRCRVHQASAAV
jgi:hexokinase